MHRTDVRYSPALLQEYWALDQKSLLERLECPVLLIHGDQGQDERYYASITEQGRRYLRQAEVVVLKGADHDFGDT